MLPNEMEPLVLHPPVPLAQVAPQPTATTAAIPMLPVLSTMATDQEAHAIPTSTNTTTNVTATTTATTEPPATTIRACPSIQRLEQILNNLPLTSQQQTAGRQDIVQNAAEDTTPTVPGKGKGRVTRTSPELDSDDEFWKEAMGKTLENTDSKDTPTIQSGSRSSITPIPEEVSADSEVSDTETGARKHSRKSSDSEEDTIANSPLNDPFFPPPPPPVHVRVSLHRVSLHRVSLHRVSLHRVSLHRVSLHCDNVEPDHASEVSPTTMARLLQGNSRIPRIVAPGQVRTTGMPSFTRLGNQNTSMCPPTPQPQQRNIDPNAAEALACLDRMNHFTPLAPCPGSSSEAALTLTPPNGFPRIHADHPFWYLEDMQGEQSCQWCSLFGTALAVVPYSFSANDLAFRAAVLAIVPRVVTQHFNVQNPHLAPPLALTDTHRTNQLPFAYLLYNLTPAEYEALLCQYCISTADLTFFIYDLSGEIPHYIRTLSSFTSSDSTELRDVIIARLCENASIQILIDILGVQVLDLRGPGGYPAPAANLYMVSPSKDLEQWLVWRNHIYRQLFPTNFIGCGQGHPGWRCSGCHVSDHPRGLCPFPRVPGWRGPNNTENGGNDEHDNNNPPDNSGAGPSGSRSNGPPSHDRPAGGRGRGHGRY
ncbi:hypothetical protein BKA93DRAFT_748181 [Sparassis latifolia]